MTTTAKRNGKAATNGEKPAKVVPMHGRGALYAGGVPGNKGGSGRPPEEFQARMRELVTRTDQAGYIEAVLNNPDHPHWLGALKWATERGYGSVPKTIELAGEGRGAVQTVVWKFGDRLLPLTG